MLVQITTQTVTIVSLLNLSQSYLFSTSQLRRTLKRVLTITAEMGHLVGLGLVTES